MEDYIVYIIHSNSADQYYIGHTSNLSNRLKRHNCNRSKFTRGKGHWEVIITYSVITKKEAYQLEMKLKHMKIPRKQLIY